MIFFKLVKQEAGNTATQLTIWGPAHAYTELAIFDGLAGENQVYKTNEELKAGLINAYKEFLTEYKEAVEKSSNLTIVSENFLTNLILLVFLRKEMVV